MSFTHRIDEAYEDPDKKLLIVVVEIREMRGKQVVRMTDRTPLEFDLGTSDEDVRSGVASFVKARISQVKAFDRTTHAALVKKRSRESLVDPKDG